jgi:hypothetical protein
MPNDRIYECTNCGEEIEVPDTIPIADIPDYLEGLDWSRYQASPNEDEGEWLCPECNEATGADDDPDTA